MNIKWVIFDVMGVIFTVGDDTNELLVPFIQKRNGTITKEYINKIYMDASLGKITSLEFWNKMGIYEKGKEDLVCKKYLDTCLTIDESFAKVAKGLKEKYHLAILSNDIGEWSKYLRNKFDLDDFIELSIISGDVKCRKPSPDIYKIALERTGAKPEHCVFIDDKIKNLIPAANEGMHIIRFVREEEPAQTEDAPSIKSFRDLEKALSTLEHPQ